MLSDRDYQIAEFQNEMLNRIFTIIILLFIGFCILLLMFILDCFNFCNKIFIRKEENKKEIHNPV